MKQIIRNVSNVKNVEMSLSHTAGMIMCNVNVDYVL